MATDLCPSSMLDRLLAVLYDWSWNANLSPSLNLHLNQIRIGIDGSEPCCECFLHMSWKKHSFSSNPSFGTLSTHWHPPTLVPIASSHSWVLPTFTTSPHLYLFSPRNSSYPPQPTPMVATYTPRSFILHDSWLYLTMKWRQATPLLQCSSCGVIKCMRFQTQHYDITQRKEEMRRSVTGSY